MKLDVSSTGIQSYRVIHKYSTKLLLKYCIYTDCYYTNCSYTDCYYCLFYGLL